MTLQQQAYRLIDDMPEDFIEAIIKIMLNVRIDDGVNSVSATNTVQNVEDERALRMQAFNRMQDLRKISKKYIIDDYDNERTNAMYGKYGSYMNEAIG